MKDEKYYTYLPQEHMVVLYRNENEIIDILVNYVKTNIENNNKCIYITGDTDSKVFMSSLEKAINVNSPMNRGQFVILDKEGSYSKDGLFHPDKMIETLISETQSAIANGFNGLAITGEISWVLAYDDGFEKIMEYEWKLNDRVFSKHPVSSICRYNLNKFTDEMIKNIIQVHPYVIWKDKAHENPFYIPVEAFENNEMSRYQVETWLENISKFTSVKSEFKTKLEGKEKQLIESEEKYRYIFDNSPVAKSTTSLNGEVKVNNAFCKLLGYTKEQLEGENWEAITYPDDIEISQREIADLISGSKNTIRFTKRYIHKNGSLVWAEVHSCLRRDTNGEPQYFMTSIIDITAQKKFEQELLTTREDFKILFEDAPLPYQSLDENGNFITVNRAWLETLGYDKDEVIGKNFSEFINPDYHEHFRTNFPKFKYEGQTCTIFEIPTKDGSMLSVNFNGRIGYNADGSFRQTHCIMQNITDQLKAERELREATSFLQAALDNSHAGIAIADASDGKLRYVNRAGLLIRGETDEELIEDVGIDKYVDSWSILHLDGTPYEPEKVPLARAVLYGETCSEEFIIRRDSAEDRVVLAKSAPITDADNNIKAGIVVFLDITEQKELENKLRYLSLHDQLTDLNNRRSFELELKRFDNEQNLPLSVIMGDINGVKLVNDAFGHSEGDRLIIESANIMKSCCREKDTIARIGGDEFAIIMPNTDSVTALEMLNSILHALKAYDAQIPNDRFLHNVSLGFGTKKSNGESIEQIVKIAEDYMYQRKLLEHDSSHSAILNSIKATMFEKSHETEEHAERLVELSRMIASGLDLSQSEMDRLEVLATLHDIGKVAISDQILNKPGKLTQEEWVVMKRHPEIGYRIAMSSPELISVAEGILCHQERWDGTGYPQALQGEKIPLLSRIIAVVDAYDAMTQDRPYRRAMTHEVALAEIIRNAGTQFDPTIAQIFAKKCSEDTPGNE